MASKRTIVRIGDMAESVSETHDFGKDNLIFLNTSDVLFGKPLHCAYSRVNDMPGQAKKSIKKDDILFSEIRPANGRWAYIDFDADDYVVSTKLMVIRAKKSLILPKFLYYFLTSSEITKILQHLAESRSGTFPQITFDQVSTLELSLPSLAEQHGISQILSTLDGKIEMNRRMNETLEAIARAIFKAWFVDFDPVRAKMDGRWRKGGSTPGLPAALYDLFPDRFHDSEMGPVPEGWDIRKIEDVAERVAMGPFGSSIKVETFIFDGVPIISGKHLHGFMLEDSTFNFIGYEHAERLKNAIVQRGDVVFTHAGNIGQAAFIPAASRYDHYVISQRQFFLRCNLSRITPTYIALYFNSPNGRNLLLANTSSSGVPSIARPVTYLRSIRLPIPKRTVLDSFEKVVKPFLLHYRQNMETNMTLASIRDTLLPKLISGELYVKDAEKFIGRTAV